MPQTGAAFVREQARFSFLSEDGRTRDARLSPIRRSVKTVVAIAALSALSAIAQTYPTKPVRFIVGPGPDVLPRLLGQKLTEGWGQQVVVDQRPGAGGIIAADTVAKSMPDGYTLLLTTGAYSINASLYEKLPYDLERDLAPVALLASIPFLVVVPPSFPAKSMRELVQIAKAKPGQLNCAHSGPGTTAHLGCEMLKSAAGISIVPVPYKGVAPALVDVMSGQAQLMFAVMQGGLPHVQSGKLRAVAITGSKRSAALPDLPTITEVGFAAADFVSWNGVHVRKGTPKSVIAKLNADFNRALRLPDVQERMPTLGLEPAGGAPEAFGEFVRNDIARWAKVVRASGVRVE